VGRNVCGPISGPISEFPGDAEGDSLLVTMFGVAGRYSKVVALE